MSLKEKVAEFEKEEIKKSLKKNKYPAKGSLEKTALELDISIPTIYRKMGPIKKQGWV